MTNVYGHPYSPSQKPPAAIKVMVLVIQWTQSQEVSVLCPIIVLLVCFFMNYCPMKVVGNFFDNRSMKVAGLFDFCFILNMTI